MAYTQYATAEDYKAFGLAEIENVEGALRSASRHVDTLTFNRIQAAGLANLTEFQRDIIKEVVCRMAEFEAVNADALTSMVDSYTINGVNVKYAVGGMVKVIGGIPIREVYYKLLTQTGLTRRAVS